MKVLILTSTLVLLQACSFQVKNCELEPSAEVNDIQIDQPIGKQINPKAEVTCTY